MKTEADKAWWAGKPHLTPTKRYSGAELTSVYLPMKDGTKISVDLYLPRGLEPGVRVPAVLSISPYFKSTEYRHPWFKKIVAALSLTGAAEFAELLAPYGFASVAVDMRGAGASYGAKKSNMMPDVISDAGEVMDWVVQQPWSNGGIASTGVSAPGMTALWLMSDRHPALKAVIPRFTVFDIYRSTRPGGLQLNRFVQSVGNLVRAMESNQLHRMGPNPVVRFILWALIKGIRPADDDTDRSQLAEAVADHVRSERFDEDLAAVVYRDDALRGAAEPSFLNDCSPVNYLPELRESNVPFYAWAGWYDGAFAREMLGLYNSVEIPGRRIVIGPWGHGARWMSSPVTTLASRRRVPTAFDHIGEMSRFLDATLKGDDHGLTGEAPIHYYTMVEERWKATDQWPPAGVSDQDMFLAGSRSLSWTEPSESGSDTYAVDFTAATGRDSRFGRHLAGGRYPVVYPDRATKDRRLLCFESPTLAEDTEITGHPLATLHLSSSAPDGAVWAYLEDVQPDGSVVMITDGGVRLCFATSSGETFGWDRGPARPYTRESALEITPGTITEVVFDLLPTSYLVRRGHRLRLAITGADEDNFVPVAQDKRPRITVHHGPQAPSRLRLPVNRG